MKAVKFELDQFKGRLSTIYTFQDFLRMEHKIVEELNTAIDSDSKADILPILGKLKDRLEKSLNINTIKTLNRKTKTRRVKRRHNHSIEDVRY
jgi:hypothetical protein